jgi:hypothetical protein
MSRESIRSTICLAAILLSLGMSRGDAQANVGMKMSASAEIDPFFITSLAKSGQASAQLILGEMHLTGKGLPLDYSEALKWFRAAAEQGEAEALRRLGFMYESGLGVKRDLAQADLLYDRAAKSGDLISSYRFGFSYMGMNVP